MLYNNLCFLLFVIAVLFLTNHISALVPEGIVGGSYAQPHTIEFHAGILIRSSNWSLYNAICGAGIIADDAVLASAHCFIDDTLLLDDYLYSVVVDTIDFKNLALIPKVDVLAIYTTSFGEKFSITDIVVVKLKGSLGIGRNPYIRALKLPQPYEEVQEGYGTVTGFGYTWVETTLNSKTGSQQFRGDGDGKLKFALVKIHLTNPYRQKYDNPNTAKEFYGSIVTDKNGQKWGICSGDSGNPLVLGNKLLGIVNRGPINCYDGVVGSVFSKVSRFVTFIRFVLYRQSLIVFQNFTNKFGIKHYHL